MYLSPFHNNTPKPDYNTPEYFEISDYTLRQHEHQIIAGVLPHSLAAFLDIHHEHLSHILPPHIPWKALLSLQ